MAKKGQKFKTWTVDEKYNVIKPIIDLEISLAQTGKNTGVSNSMLHRWIKSYKENGYDGLKAKKKPGNPLMKYSRKIYRLAFLSSRRSTRNFFSPEGRYSAWVLRYTG